MERKYSYGHNLTIAEIQKILPFSNKTIKRALMNESNYTISFDVQMAYRLLKKGYKCIIWGGIYNDVYVFVFKKKRIKTRSLPF